MRGEHPLKSMVSMLTPTCSKMSTIPTCPLTQAQWIGCCRRSLSLGSSIGAWWIEFESYYQITVIQFPIQRVAAIVASRAAAIFIFLTFFVGFGRKILAILKQTFFFCKNEKKSSQSAFFDSPGR